MTINNIQNGESGASVRAKLNATIDKSNGIAAGATANSTDAQLRDRATHTGTQAIATVSGLQSELDSKLSTANLATVATTGAYSDLSGRPTLGTAAAANTSDFATSAQGGLADTAVQPGDLATVATTGAYDDLSNRPTLGTAAATNATDYATAAQGDLADSAVQPGDLGTMASQDADSVAITGGTVLGADRLGLSTTGGLIPAQGQFVWDDDNQTAQLGLNGSTLGLGQELHYHVRNNTGASIPKGTAVRAAGTIGLSGRITIAPMLADGSVSAQFFLGVTREAIAPGADGKVTSFGKVRGIDTSAFAEGDVLYVSPITPGALTNVEPVAPALKLAIAFVVTDSATVGSVHVRATVSATVEQGQLADSAVQSPDVASIELITQAAYDLLTPVANTLYLIEEV